MLRDCRPIRTARPRRAAPSARRSRSTDGYTVVDLVIAVAVISVLATLAVLGGRRYLAGARSADAKRSVTAIAEAAAAAYDRSAAPRALCADSTLVPAYMTQVQGRGYEPSTAPGSDFRTGSATVGWKCLGYETNEPLYYQYSYARDRAADWSGELAEPYFVARAQGDLDGDGIYARFLRGGRVEDGLVVLQTDVWLEQEME